MSFLDILRALLGKPKPTAEKQVDITVEGPDPTTIRSSLRVDQTSSVTSGKLKPGTRQFLWKFHPTINGGGRLEVSAPGFAPLSQRVELPLTTGPITTFTVPQGVVKLVGAGLTIEGQWFVRGGKKTPLKGHNEFALLRRFLVEGAAACRPVVAQRKAALGEGCVLKVGSMGDWFGLFPETTTTFYERTGDFLDFLRDELVVCELVGFVRAPTTMSNPSSQDAHWARLADVLRAHPGHLLKLMNERSHWTNEIKDWRRFQKPDGVIASHGSELSGEYPVAESWDYASMHGSRGGDWPAELIQQLEAQRVIRVPVIDSEIMGADETYQPGRRSNIPALFHRAGLLGGHTAGMWLMTQASLMSVLWGPVQEACAHVFGEGFDQSAAGLTPAPEVPPLATARTTAVDSQGRIVDATIPPRAQEIVLRLHEWEPVLANGDDDQRRQLTVMIAEQLHFELGDSWGHKRADPGRPPSKDGFAQRQPDGKIFSWDWQNGTTRAPLVPPGWHDISTQVFIPVTPQNHLGL